MFYLREVTYIKRVFCKTIRLPEHAFNVSFEKTYLNAWDVKCKHRVFQGMVKCMFSYHALNACFSKRMYNVW